MSLNNKRAIQNLQNQYQKIDELDLSRNFKVALLLNLGAVGLFVIVGVLLIWLLRAVRPDFFRMFTEFSLVIENFSTILIPLLVIVGIIIGMTLLHEAIHGAFFWLMTRDLPAFGFKGAYAYAAAPNWYIHKKPYLIISVAPLAVITMLGIGALFGVPTTWMLPIWFLVTLNASGAAGDLYVFLWILSKPKGTLIQDTGDQMKVYAPRQQD